jgi:phage tail protein X
MSKVSITTRARYLTVERIVFKQLGGYVPGAVEATIDGNFGLAANPDHLPVPTTFEIPQPGDEALRATVAPIRLVD